MSDFFNAFLQTVASTGLAAAEMAAQGKPAKGKKRKSAGCTPCAVNARIMDAKARAGFSPPLGVK